MNTGAEAVETAIKMARKWGYEVKGVPGRQASSWSPTGNFHGRTTTIVSFSTDPDARGGFGPYTPGFRVVPYGDLDAMRRRDRPEHRRRADRADPGRGRRAGPAGRATWPAVRELCTRRTTSCLLADEIQSGLGRTGATFACEHEGVVPDIYMLGKALGGGDRAGLGGRSPTRDVLGVLRPGEHGSTFGGNPLACAVGRAVIALLATGEYQERAAKLGAAPARPAGRADRRRGRPRCAAAGCGPGSTSTRRVTGRAVCERLLARGVLAKDTHGSTIRLAPPLVISEPSWTGGWTSSRPPSATRPGHVQAGPARPGAPDAAWSSPSAGTGRRGGSAGGGPAGLADPDDLADHDGVVATVVHRRGPALDRAQRVVERRRAVCAGQDGARSRPAGRPAGARGSPATGRLLRILIEHGQRPDSGGQHRIVEAGDLLAQKSTRCAPGTPTRRRSRLRRPRLRGGSSRRQRCRSAKLIRRRGEKKPGAVHCCH